MEEIDTTINEEEISRKRGKERIKYVKRTIQKYTGSTRYTDEENTERRKKFYDKVNFQVIDVIVTPKMSSVTFERQMSFVNVNVKYQVTITLLNRQN